MRSTIKKKTGLDILRLKPIENVHTCFIPALFVAGSGDEFIAPHHAQDICDKYAGDKNMVLVEGEHNTCRPAYFHDSVSIFFYNRLCAPVGLTEEKLGLRPMNVDGTSAFLMSLMNPASASARVMTGVQLDDTSAGMDMQSVLSDDGVSDSELQQVLLMSLAEADARNAAEESGHEAIAPSGNAHSVQPSAQTAPTDIHSATNRLVECATSHVQSTMPDARTAADALRTTG